MAANKRQVPAVDILIHGGDRGFTLLEKTISPGENGLWQYDDEFEKTNLIHFSCPHCAAIQSILDENISRPAGGTSIRGEDNEIYYSLWCLNTDCGAHLWIRFEGRIS